MLAKVMAVMLVYQITEAMPNANRSRNECSAARVLMRFDVLPSLSAFASKLHT